MKTIGKNIFLWNTPLVEGGNPSAIAAKLKAGNFESVTLKVANGTKSHVTRVRGKWVEAVTPETVAVLKAHGLGVYGYGFCYGADPVGEGHIAISQTISLRLDGYVFDVEGAFEGRPNAPQRARTLGMVYREGCPTIPASFCGFAMYRSWTGGTWHNVELHKAMLEWCDAGMPMDYWQGTNPPSLPHSAVSLLQESLAQWTAITPKPIYPTGRAYNGDGGIATPAAMIAFDNRLRELGLNGESWWSLDHVLKLAPSRWAALVSMPKFEMPPAPPSTQTALSLEERVAGIELEARVRGWSV